MGIDSKTTGQNLLENAESLNLHSYLHTFTYVNFNNHVINSLYA